MKTYCYFCDKEVSYNIQEKDIQMLIKGTDITYKGKITLCEECGNEIYVGELDDENITIANKEYRKRACLITVEEIQQLLDKYDIGKKPLAKLLGWGETTIERYVNGITPLKIYSDELKKLQDPKYMQKLFEGNKDVLTSVAQKKIEASLGGLINKYVPKKVDVTSVADFFLSKIDKEAGSSITPLKLQKLIYWAQGWSCGFFQTPLFTSDLQAWVHGPVSPEVYYKYQNYCYEDIEKISCDIENNFDFTQIQLLNEVYSVYGIFDAKILEAMTHKDKPWKNARKYYGPKEICQEVIPITDITEYFSSLRAFFEINEFKDIKRSLVVYRDYLSY